MHYFFVTLFFLIMCLNGCTRRTLLVKPKTGTPTETHIPSSPTQAETPQPQPYPDPWTELSSGIKYQKQTHTNGNSVHFVQVDLSSPKVLLHVSNQEEGATTPKKFAKKTGALVAINGDFFDPNSGYVPFGLSLSKGTKWKNTQVMKDWFILACGEGNACIIRAFNKNDVIDPLWKNVVGGRDQIVRDGKAWGLGEDNSCPHLCPMPAPRTSVGLTADKKFLILGTAEGYGELAGGLRVSEMADWMMKMGAANAIHLDGGGSTQMVVKDQLMTRRPDKEPEERVVGNMLGVLSLN